MTVAVIPERDRDALAKKYLGQDTGPFRRPGAARVIVEIAPEKTQGMG